MLEKVNYYFLAVSYSTLIGVARLEVESVPTVNKLVCGGHLSSSACVPTDGLYTGSGVGEDGLE
jgi:hypothetical protein